MERSIGATLYPTRIIIETRNKKNDAIWYSVDEITILPCDAADQMIGEAILRHLNNSMQLDISFDKIKRMRERFKKLTKLKTDKAIQKDAKYVTVYFADGQLRFEPFKNKVRDKNFYKMPDSSFSSVLIDNTDIGRDLRKAWSFCTFE